MSEQLASSPDSPVTVSHSLRSDPHDVPHSSASNTSSSDLVHISKEVSRRPSPFSVPPPPPSKNPGIQELPAQSEDENLDSAWDTPDVDDSLALFDDTDMPSDLRPATHRTHSQSHQSQSHQSQSHQNQPLLSGDKHAAYESPTRPLATRRSTNFRGRDSDAVVKSDTRKRYTYAAGFLVLSLISFAVQTETAVYIQHNLHWNKAYCMLYFTHGSWSSLWFVQLLILRLQKWNQPWDSFWRRHISILRSTAQMIEHRNLDVPAHLQKKSPVPYFIRTTAFVTCALTVAGGSWYLAVDLTSASDLTAIYNCSAFFAYAFAIPLLGEKVRISKVAAVAVAIIGVLVVAYGDQGTAKHGNKSGGGAGGPNAPDDSEASDRTLGNLIIGVGSVLYGFYEVLYKRVACPPDGCSPGRGMIFANAFGSMIGIFTLSVLWIPLPILHFTGLERFELPTGEAAWMLAISVLANAVFSGSFLILISLTSPVLSSVAALLTIFIVAICDQMLPPPLYSPLTGAALVGGLLIIGAFILLSWATYREMEAESKKRPEDIVEESDIEDV